MVSLNFSQNQSEGDPDLSTTENEDANTTQVFCLKFFILTSLNLTCRIVIFYLHFFIAEPWTYACRKDAREKFTCCSSHFCICFSVCRSLCWPLRFKVRKIIVSGISWRPCSPSDLFEKFSFQDSRSRAESLSE